MEKSAALRTKTIDLFLKDYKSKENFNEEYARLLSNGFVPHEIVLDFFKVLDEAIESMKDEPPVDTELDMMQYSNFFYLHPEKVAGKEVPGSGFINPVNTKGNLEDVLKAIPYELPTSNTKKATPMEKDTTSKSKYSQGETVRVDYLDKIGKIDKIFSIKKGKFIPGQGGTTPTIEYKYTLKFEDGTTDTFSEDEIELASDVKNTSQYDFNKPIARKDFSIVETFKGDGVKIIKFEWNGGFYEWRYDFRGKGGGIKISKYPTLNQLKNPLSTTGNFETIYNTWNSSQQTEEGVFLEYSISQLDKKEFFKVEDTEVKQPSLSYAEKSHINMLTEMYPKTMSVDTTQASKEKNKVIAELEKMGLVKRISYEKGFAEYGLADKEYKTTAPTKTKKETPISKEAQNVVKEEWDKMQEFLAKDTEEPIKEVKKPETKAESVPIKEALTIQRVLNDKNDTAEIITIEESLKKYNPGITEPEIKGWVYYKKLFGNPMRGWEKYFLKESKNKEILIYSSTSFYLKDQQFHDVKMVPSGTLLGIKTRFSNEYDKETFWVIKNEANELYYASEKNITEKVIGNAAAQDELIELVKQKGLCYSDGDFIPIPLYAYGNIYDIKDRLVGKFNKETNKFEGGYFQTLIDMFGKEIADWHLQLVDDAIKIKGEFFFNDATPSKRPFLASENPISTEFMVRRLNDESGVDFEKIFEATKKRSDRHKRYNEEETNYTLFQAYEHWFNTNVNDGMLQKTTKRNIVDFYFNNRKISGDLTDKEKDEMRLNARIEGEKFYGEFLATALTRNDITALNIVFNRKYNSISKINLDKVPVGFETNQHIFNSNFELKPVQRNGIAFMAASNSGCLAYDVGFGKTLTAIHNLAALLKQSAIKRPLIIVPKQVYNNWIREMFGFWSNGKEARFEEFKGSVFTRGALTGTKYKLNTWFNLNKNVEFSDSLVEADTITLMTYEGFYKLGFSSKLNEELFDDLFTILTTGKTDATARQEAKQKEDVKKMMGIGVADTVIDIDTCGFDYLVFDEAHAFKNVFNSVPLDEGQNNVWRLKSKSTPTKRAVKAFFHSLYIQKKYGGNVQLLTATPFTNSPLEIFSMLALTGYETLKKYNLQNLYEFLGLFIETEVEYAVNYANEIVLNTVIKSFKNKNLLRDILYRHFDYQDDPKVAGVKRPCKLNFPNNKVSTYLEMSPKQAEAQVIVREEAASFDPKTNRGAMGRALNWAKNNSLSPFLLRDIVRYETLEELIEESPKLNYTLQCIKSIKDWHEQHGQEMSGQVIYSNRGVDLFDDFKAALEEECGFKRKVAFGESFVDEIEIITGGGSEKELEHKELVKDAFNEGYCKVIIGTGTIKEGVNLQKRGTTLYNLDLDWNPTDFKQLEGRIHRQGNLFKYVRVTVPMVQNTLDSFINQKLDEKNKRISSIWDKDNQSNSIDEYNAVDPLEIKFALIDDANELLKMKIDKDKAQTQKNSTISKEKYEAIQKIDTVVNEFKSTWEDMKNEVAATFENHKMYITYLNKYKKGSGELSKGETDSIDDLIKKVSENNVLFEDFYQNGNYKSLFEAFRNITARSYTFKTNTGSTRDFGDMVEKFTGANYYGSFDTYNNWHAKKLTATYGDMKKLERMVLQPYGLTIDDNFDGVKKKFKAEHETYENELLFLNSIEYQEKALLEIQAELKRRASQRGTIEQRVQEFASYNYLLSFPFDKETADSCEVPADTGDYTGSTKIMTSELEKQEDEIVTISDLQSNDIKKNKGVTEERSKGSEKAELLKKYQAIIPFMPYSEGKVVKQHIEEHADSINALYEVITTMPKTYETDEIPTEEKIAYLHYFRGGSDWFILEKDAGNPSEKDFSQTQAFGYTILNQDYQNAEYGYINIEELKELVELDLHFTPKLLSEATQRVGKKEKTQAKEVVVDLEPTLQDLKDSLDGAETALEFSEGKEKKSLIAYIDGLKIAIEMNEL